MLRANDSPRSPQGSGSRLPFLVGKAFAMPSSAQNTAHPATAAYTAAGFGSQPAPSMTHFGVVPFRRDATGAIVPGTAVEVPNGDIAWRRARAEAFEHGNVGAAVLSGADVESTGRVTNGVLIAFFGEVALDSLGD